MRTVLTSLLISVACTGLGIGLGACGNSNSGGSFDTGDDGGGSSGSSSGNGSSGGGSSGSASSSGSGSSSGSTGSSGGGSSSGSGSSSGCTTNTGPISGTVGNSGGSVSRLVFAVAGDTRPANEDDTSGYPTAIITKIFQDIQALSPRPVLTIGTGDYQFSSASSDGTGAAQVQLYMQARAIFTGPYFPAMGNHECGVSGTYTTSDNNDCGPGNPGGVTTNYNAFINEMMAPLSQTNPYYSINVNATDNSWTAKFVVTAANAWDTAQQTWMEGVMAQKTTYTFVVRHEPSDATPPLPTGVAGVDAILAQYPYTLMLTGHTHSYGHYSDAPQTVVFGNGGAPLSSKDYGYGLFSQRCDGAIVADAIDYESGAADSEFHFVITPQGTITQ